MENLIVNLLNIYLFIFLARALLSWFPIDDQSAIYPIARGIHKVTEPALAPIRSFMPRTGGFDFSIFVVIFGIRLLVIPIVRAIIPN